MEFVRNPPKMAMTPKEHLKFLNEMDEADLAKAFEIRHTTDEVIIEAAAMAGRLRAKREARLPWPDLLVAAHARVERTFVVSRDMRDFRATGVPRWDFGAGTKPPAP